MKDHLSIFTVIALGQNYAVQTFSRFEFLKWRLQLYRERSANDSHSAAVRYLAMKSLPFRLPERLPVYLQPVVWNPNIFPAIHCTTSSQGCSCSWFYFWSGITKGMIFWDCLGNKCSLHLKNVPIMEPTMYRVFSVGKNTGLSKSFYILFQNGCN